MGRHRLDGADGDCAVSDGSHDSIPCGQITEYPRLLSKKVRKEMARAPSIIDPIRLLEGLAHGVGVIKKVLDVHSARWHRRDDKSSFAEHVQRTYSYCVSCVHTHCRVDVEG